MTTDIIETYTAQQLFFLVYYPRSGSTFLADLLTRHPQVAVAPEADFLHKVIKWVSGQNIPIKTEEKLKELLDLIYADPKFHTWDVPRYLLKNCLEMYQTSSFYLTDLVRVIMFLSCKQRYDKQNVKIYGYKKDGWYVQNIPLLKSLFPEAKFIYVFRDGRAAYASGKKAISSLTGVPLATNPKYTARQWRKSISSFNAVQHEPFTFDVQYETLIRNPEREIIKVLNFLSIKDPLPVLETLYQVNQSNYVVQPQLHLHKNVGTPPNVQRIDQWRNELTDEEKKHFERIAGLELVEKGYELEYSTIGMAKLYRLYEILLKKISKTEKVLKVRLKNLWFFGISWG